MPTPPIMLANLLISAAILVGVIAAVFGIRTLIKWNRWTRQNTPQVTAALEQLDAMRDELEP